MARKPRQRTPRKNAKVETPAPAPVIEGVDTEVETPEAAPKAEVAPEVAPTPVPKAKSAMSEAEAFLDEIYQRTTPDESLDHKSYVGPKDKFEEIGKHQLDVMKKAGLKPEHRMLDLGCGAMRGGKHALQYLEAGNYYGIEPHKVLLKKGMLCEVKEDLAREKVPTFKFNSNFNLSIFEKEFDFILAQSIFSHAGEKHIKDCLASAFEVLKSGGKFVFNYCKGEADYKGETWVYPNATKFKELTMLKYVREAGFDVEKNDSKHPNGLTWMTAKKQ